MFYLNEKDLNEKHPKSAECFETLSEEISLSSNILLALYQSAPIRPIMGLSRGQVSDNADSYDHELRGAYMEFQPSAGLGSPSREIPELDRKLEAKLE
jgi:hypothetical protein